MTTPIRPIKHQVKSPAPSVFQGTVTLYEQTWDIHIGTKHGDVSLGDVVLTMEDPCLVCESKTEPGKLILVNTFAYNAMGQELRLPLKDLGSGNHIVTSAYFGNAPHGTVAWQRGDDD